MIFLAVFGRERIKFKFYLTTEDLEELYTNGFVKANSLRVLATEVVNDLEKRDTKQDSVLKDDFHQDML